ncbi:MAG: hypothetical protein V3S79_00740 [Candidatus Thermoplasmatota archaeon]
MKNEFVTHDIALALKKLGFNEKCLACYDEKGVFGLTVMSIKKYYTNSKEDTWNCAAPLYQQAFRWFREKHSLTGRPTIGNQEYSFRIFDEKEDKTIREGVRELGAHFNGSYEQAELACLRRLIEIVKNKED